MPEKFKYPPNDPFLERRHSKVFRKRHGEFFEVVIFSHNSLQNQDFFSFLFSSQNFHISRLSLTHSIYAYHKLHPKTHSAIPPEYGDTTCVRRLHSVATYRGPTCREHHQAFWSTQANSDISLLHVKIIIYLLENYIEPQNIIYVFLAKTLENTMAVIATFYLALYLRSNFSNVFKKTVLCLKKTNQ